MDMNNNLSNKAEYVCADYFRLICAIGVVALHLDPFYDVNEYVDFFIGSFLARLCVPYFFLLSGFFLRDKLSDWSRLSKYLKNLIKLYVVYTVVSFPMIFRSFKDNGKTMLEDAVFFLRNFFLVGSYGQLWYFLALIFAVAFLYVMTSKFKVSENTMIIIMIFLYLIGLFYRVYDKPIRDSIEKIRIITLYDDIFKTSRNGLFFGAPLVYLGNLVWKKDVKVNRRKCAFLFAISLILLLLEAIFARYVIGTSQLDMLLILPATSVLFLILVLSKNMNCKGQKFALWCRRISVYIFGLHLFVFFCVKRILERMEISPNSLCKFCIVLVANVMLGIIFTFLSKSKYGKWIEKVFL